MPNLRVARKDQPHRLLRSTTITRQAHTMPDVEHEVAAGQRPPRASVRGRCRRFRCGPRSGFESADGVDGVVSPDAGDRHRSRGRLRLRLLAGCPRDPSSTHREARTRRSRPEGRLAPATLTVSGDLVEHHWWRGWDLNPRPSGYEPTRTRDRLLPVRVVQYR